MRPSAPTCSRRPAPAPPRTTAAPPPPHTLTLLPLGLGLGLEARRLAARLAPRTPPASHASRLARLPLCTPPASHASRLARHALVHLAPRTPLASHASRLARFAPRTPHASHASRLACLAPLRRPRPRAPAAPGQLHRASSLRPSSRYCRGATESALLSCGGAAAAHLRAAAAAAPARSSRASTIARPGFVDRQSWPRSTRTVLLASLPFGGERSDR